MGILKVIVYCILAYGLANTLIYANGPFHIFAHMHRILPKIHPHLEEMFSCFICLPYWIGFFFSALDIFLFEDFSFTPMNICLGASCPWWLVILFDGIFTSGAVWLINTVQSKYEHDANRDGDGGEEPEE